MGQGWRSGTARICEVAAGTAEVPGPSVRDRIALQVRPDNRDGACCFHHGLDCIGCCREDHIALESHQVVDQRILSGVELDRREFSAAARSATVLFGGSKQKSRENDSARRA